MASSPPDLRPDETRKSFLVCEPIARGLEHVPFNAGLLTIIRTGHPERRIVFCAESEHSEHVRRQLGEDIASSIEWSTITVPARDAEFYRRLPSDFRRVRGLLERVKSDNSSVVCTFSSGNASILWSLKFLVSTFHRAARVQVVLHGDFSLLRYRTSLRRHLNPLYHLGSFRTAIRWACDRRVQHVVLEESVRDAVVEKYSFLRDRFVVLDHPLPGDRNDLEPRLLASPVCFGFLGRAYESKGFSSFLAVAVDISTRFPGLAEFHLIGSVDAQQQEQYATELTFLAIRPETATLDRGRFLDRLGRMHYVCLFYDDTYEFTASGVLLDCVEWGKPIVGSRRSLFVHLEREFGEIGYLCDETEAQSVIEGLLMALDSGRYHRQVEAMLAIKVSRGPSVLAQRYSQLVEQFSQP